VVETGVIRFNKQGIHAQTGSKIRQDVILLKSGDDYRGIFFGKVEENIFFKVEVQATTTKFPVSDVVSIATSNDTLFHPFEDLSFLVVEENMAKVEDPNDADIGLLFCATLISGIILKF